MPYIDPKLREAIDPILNQLLDYDFTESPGVLNYIITKLCNEYVGDNNRGYSTFNEIIGVLESAKLEFYRRILSPYENKKKRYNGDVYKI